MKDQRSTFPLPLSSVTGTTRKPGTPAPVATPQTATQTAARNSVHGQGRAAPPPAPGPSPRPPGYAQAAPSAPAAQRSDLAATEAVRRAMVARIARQGVLDAKVLAAMETVPRHLFIEPALSAQA